jgi:hypothetical protein
MIDYTIPSENSSDHWPYFDVDNKNVLDIGCGIWYTKDMEETSPIFFAKTANYVVAIDSNDGDIEKFKEYVKEDKKFTFKKVIVTDAQQIRDLITEYSINALKCDIEGHERVLLGLTNEDLESVTEMAIEFHTHDLKDSFMKKIPEWGYNIKCVANFAATPDNMGVIFASK